MKLALKISALLNLGLLGCLVFTWLSLEKQEAGASRSASPPMAAQKAAAVAPAVTPVTLPPATAAEKPAAPAPFRWQQLESDDYRTYIKNLRNIGCPETTLLAIVTADVDAVYQNRSQELDKKLADLTGRSWAERLAGVDQEKAVQAEILKLPDAERATIDDLLGLKHATTVTAQTELSQDPVPRPVAIPVVLQNFDPAAAGLSDEQIQIINNLRQKFVAQIGGANQDPNDPAYLARWQKAQPAIDQTMKGLLGSRAFIQLQAQATSLQVQAARQQALAALQATGP